MILLQSHSRYLLQLLSTRVQNIEKGAEIECRWFEFDDVEYHIKAEAKNANILRLSLSLPLPTQETVIGLPQGIIEAIKAAYGSVLQIHDPAKDGFNLTVKLNLSKLPPEEGLKEEFLMKIASIREVVQGAPLRAILRQLILRTVRSDSGTLIPLVYRTNETYFVIPQVEKVTFVFPMRFKDPVDTVLATSFLQEFVEAKRATGLSNAPLVSYSSSPPEEMKRAPDEALSANAGFVTFVILPRHVEGRKLDRTAWALSTFPSYVSYHVKCSVAFMHTLMRRRVESLIEALDRAKSEPDEAKKTAQARSFKRLSIRDGHNSSNSR